MSRLADIIGSQHNASADPRTGLAFHMEFSPGEDNGASSGTPVAQLRIIKLPYESFMATADQLEELLLATLLNEGEVQVCDHASPIQCHLNKAANDIARETRRGVGNTIIGEPIFLAAARERVGERAYTFAECDSVPEKCLIVTYIGRSRGDCSPVLVTHDKTSVYGLVTPSIKKYVKVLRWDS